MKTGNHLLETVDLLNPTEFKNCKSISLYV